MGSFFLALILLISTLPAALAQDERRVASPNGKLEFRLFVVAEPEGALWPRLAYQVLFRDKPLISTSYLGIDLLNQEPFLGENPGFMYSDAASDPTGHYNSLVAHYMQNGSLGRRLDVEVRAYDDGVAFRYLIPKSTPVDEVLVRDEATEFNFAQPGVLAGLAAKPDFDLPFVVDQPGTGWVAIAEAGKMNPRTYLIHRNNSGMITNLSRSASDPVVAFAGKTPIIWSWRVILVGSDREHLLKSPTLLDLER
jgi:alpha-glucosidase